MQVDKYTPVGETDAERLKDAMEQLKNHKFVHLDEAVFEDGSLAESFNEMTESLLDTNNRMTMRLNDALSRIADNTILRDMVNAVKNQKKSMDEVKAIADHLVADNTDNAEIQYRILSLVRQACCTIQPIYDEVEKFGIAEAEGRHEEAGTHFNRAMSYLDTIREQLDSLRDSVNFYCAPDEVNDAVYMSLASSVDGLFAKYAELLRCTYDNGRNRYRISRDIDSARSENYRHNSKVSIVDCTKVFSVDHLTLSWRIFNHIAEYERLRIEQLNNPETCKFGVWCSNMDIDIVKNSEEMRSAMEAHNTLHEHAVNAYLAYEEANYEASLEEFKETLKMWEVFDAALKRLADFLRANGFEDETEVWVFNPKA